MERLIVKVLVLESIMLFWSLITRILFGGRYWTIFWLLLGLRHSINVLEGAGFLRDSRRCFLTEWPYFLLFGLFFNLKTVKVENGSWHLFWFLNLNLLWPARTKLWHWRGFHSIEILSNGNNRVAVAAKAEKVKVW